MKITIHPAQGIPVTKEIIESAIKLALLKPIPKLILIQGGKP